VPEAVLIVSRLTYCPYMESDDYEEGIYYEELLPDTVS